MSPRKAKKPSAARRTYKAPPTEADAITVMPKSAGVPRLASSVFKVTADGDATLSKRARQRRRQAQARQFAKALESTDGVGYKARSGARSDMKMQIPLMNNLPKPTTNEWIRVQRNRSTLHERIQRRRALLARARALVREAQMLKGREMEKPPLIRQVWRPKSQTTDEAKASVKAPPVQIQRIQVHPTKNQPPKFAPPRTQPTPAITPKTSVFERLGPLKHETPTPLKRPRTASEAKSTANRLGLRVEVQRPAKATPPQGKTWRRVTFGTIDPEESCPQAIGCSGVNLDELYYRTGGAGKKRRSSSEANSSCLCSKLIKAVLSECKCCRETPKKVSVFQRLTAETPKSRSRQSHRRLTPRLGDELPEVTVNVINKVTPSRGVPKSSQRVTRLRAGTIKRPNYRNLQRGIPLGHNLPRRVLSEDEMSNADSAMASDNTVSSEGRHLEANMISTEQVAKMLEDALAKQKESFKFEMEMAMQQMREMYDQQIQLLNSHQGESSRRNTANQVDGDMDREEEPILDNPRNNQNAGGSQENASGNATIPSQSHPRESANENEKIRELESKINALISTQEVKKTGIPCPYPREWDAIPYPAKFSLINFTPFDGKGSPTQHLIYFKSHLGVISGNEPLMVRSFVGTLRGAAFDWYRRLKAGSINSWDDMESKFLLNFFDDDTEISLGVLLDEKQINGETVDSFVKRFRNKALNCRDPITEDFILQTCQHNLSLDVIEAMGTAPSKTWKDLKIRGEQAERFLKRKKAERGRQTENTHQQNFVSREKGKAPAKAVDANQTSHSQQQQAPPQSQQPQKPRASTPRFPQTYAFDNDEVPGIFKYLLENNKIQLPPIANQEEAKMVTDPKYCAYHRAVHHPTKACYQLKDKIQALIEVGVITPKPKK